MVFKCITVCRAESVRVLGTEVHKVKHWQRDGGNRSAPCPGLTSALLISVQTLSCFLVWCG